MYLKICQKKRCWACGSLEVIKWGRQAGRQRFRCKSCGILFSSSNHKTSLTNKFIWFQSWVLGRQTLKQISISSGYSERTLKRLFKQYLSQSPVFSVRPSEKVNLIIDGTYFSNNLCLVIYRDNSIKYTQLYRLSDGEHYEEMREDIENLLKLGVQIESITCDGHKALLKAIRKVCRHVIIQRCVIHVQRMCRIWLTAKPKSEAGYELKKIVGKIHTISNRDQWGYWIVSLVRWHERYESFIKEKSFSIYTKRYWYKHKMVRRAFITIKRALPNMFNYLENPMIPKSTNGLESFFGHLKSHISIHRGLSKKNRESFIKWYLFYRNR